MLDSVGESWRVLESVGECWRVLESVGECWRVLKSIGECWRVLESISADLHCPHYQGLVVRNLLIFLKSRYFTIKKYCKLLASKTKPQSILVMSWT